ncbi:hypothetical protein PP740_gp030 [Stenotrophomonas phage Philippe]|uniref:Uncharacterized protein n=1 Tax=Stenotrophomonas phage Philippe TaxID=2859655 RepID=A0AAE8BI34_9CAUD|nr:hypothetical protein PP740_gp030 [Stenotrophomonas phage Philippe]QYW02229.1 hypothetical protein CPT_Philippe_030 [Stenotrophomonas phage Philippe]
MDAYDTAQRADSYYQRVINAPAGKWVRVTCKYGCKESRRKTWEQLLLMLDLFGHKYETPKANHFSIRLRVEKVFKPQTASVIKAFQAIVDDIPDPLPDYYHQLLEAYLK